MAMNGRTMDGTPDWNLEQLIRIGGRMEAYNIMLDEVKRIADEVYEDE